MGCGQHVLAKMLYNNYYIEGHPINRRFKVITAVVFTTHLHNRKESTQSKKIVGGNFLGSIYNATMTEIDVFFLMFVIIKLFILP